jgi:nitrogen-specific signal transduction histidine kinase
MNKVEFILEHDAGKITLPINPENLKKIFEPYFTTRDNGTGLGLTLVYKIIREHQGDISVDSREGGGTDFEIILPVYRREQKLIPEKTSVTGGAKV